MPNKMDYCIPIYFSRFVRLAINGFEYLIVIYHHFQLLFILH